MGYRLSIILIAYIMDLIFGDPQWRWHPVRLIGKLIEKLEAKLNRPAQNLNKRSSGLILVISVVGVTVFSVWSALKIAKYIHPIFHYILSVLFIYFALSVKALAVEANRIRESLTDKNMEEARRGLSMIVGRDTAKLGEPEIIRATVETVAESAMDGIIAPLFYSFIGGPILAWAYKAVNTLDSMVGYRSERFIEFGSPSARLDAVLNFIPARITALLISASGFFYKKDALSSLKWGLKYFFKGPEFNSEMTEASIAGALGVRLGGVNFYNSVPSPKPFIGDEREPLAIKHIREAIRLAYIASFLFIFILTWLGLSFLGA